MPNELTRAETVELFELLLRFKGTNAAPPPAGQADNPLAGKKVGLVDAGSWIPIWGDYFGRKLLPGVEISHICDDSIQKAFMQARAKGEPVPPQGNIDRFGDYALNLASYGYDAVLLTCSTMNRSYPSVARRLQPLGVPVVQIDRPMCEQAVQSGKKIGLFVTLATSVRSSELLLEETAKEMGCVVAYATYLREEAFTQLGQGHVREHNRILADAIRTAVNDDGIELGVLAQLSMSVFTFDYPDAEHAFGIPVLNSAETGFARVKELLAPAAAHPPQS
ncbi:MAG: Asp/Glu/hydantoin racemase [Kiritimatiellae bacterium]|nr:Asp/Glu/hydantoin racemase [Kiritimatiellia bacterium]